MTTTLLAALVFSVVGMETLLHLPLKRLATKLSKNLKGPAKVITSTELSDDQKQKLLLGYSWSLLQNTLKLCLLLAVWAIPLALVFLGAHYIFGFSAETFQETGFIVGSLVLATGYSLVRRRG